MDMNWLRLRLVVPEAACLTPDVEESLDHFGLYCPLNGSGHSR